MTSDLDQLRQVAEKEWRRAENAEESRLSVTTMLNTVLEEMGSGPETDPIIKVRQLVKRAEVAEQAVQRIWKVIEQLEDHSRPRTAHKFELAKLLRGALDGGEQK